ARLRRHAHLRAPRLAQAFAGIPHHARAVGETIDAALRSFPRKREPRVTDRGPWIPAYAGMNGVGCYYGVHDMGGTTQTVDKIKWRTASSIRAAARAAQRAAPPARAARPIRGHRHSRFSPAS